MMKPSLQLRIGQQLTMTPQLQQAIRLLQLPTVELQAQVLEALDSNVMLEAEEDFEATWASETLPGAATASAGEDGESDPTVEIADDWTEPNAAESESPWSGSGDGQKSLIVCGRSHLLEDVRAMEDLERVRLLFEDLETKKDLIQLLGLAERAEGVRIFIGSENKLFSLSGSALIVSPFEDTDQKIVGVLGVIGPTRLNYARIIPMVDYTARLLGRLVP